MKRKFFNYAIAAAFACSLSMGCSSTKKADNSDSTATDSAKMKAPMDTSSNGNNDTSKTKMDTTKKDTVKKP